jgi:hypothetical protein
MKLLPLSTLLAAGLMLAGCASDESSFTVVPPPSGETPVASAKPAAASSAPEELPSAPPESQPESKPTPPPAPAQTKPKSSRPAPAQTRPQPVVTPDTSTGGKVVTYNSVGRFAVLTFPSGAMPKIDQTTFVYRNGVKVGEMKITGPQRDNNIVADVTRGDAQPGDDVRDK